MRQTILNLHGVGPMPDGLDDEERDCWLDRDQFEATLELAARHSHVRLTFDDGNTSDVAIALPALLRHGLKATFFICGGRLQNPRFLNQAQLRELIAHGMTIGSHGMNHISWRRLPMAALRHELETSRRTLENICGTSIDAAACPFGDYDRRVLRELRRVGYRAVYTSDGGTCSESAWCQPRTTILRTTSLRTVEHLVRFGTGSIEQLLINVRTLVKRTR